VESAQKSVPPLLQQSFFPGDLTDRATPVPIPNTAVKPVWADDSLTAKVGRCLDFLPLTPRSDTRGEFFNSDWPATGRGGRFACVLWISPGLIKGHSILLQISGLEGHIF
jgi:hypothetical protein